MSQQEKLADMKLKSAKVAAKKFNKIITNAINKEISIDSSARDLGYKIKEIERDAKQVLSREAVDSIFQVHLTNELIKATNKNCYKIDYVELANAALIGAAKGGTVSVIFGAPGVLIGVLRGMVGGIAADIASQSIEIAKRVREQNIRREKLQEMYDEIENKRHALRMKVAAVLLAHLQRHENEIKKELKRPTLVKAKTSKLRKMIQRESKIIGTLESIAERNIRNQNFVEVRKNLGFSNSQNNNINQNMSDNGGCGSGTPENIGGGITTASPSDRLNTITIYTSLRDGNVNYDRACSNGVCSNISGNDLSETLTNTRSSSGGNSSRRGSIGGSGSGFSGGNSNGCTIL